MKTLKQIVIKYAEYALIGVVILIILVCERGNK